MTFTFDDITGLLAGQLYEENAEKPVTAAVAMVFREGAEELELLLIQRTIDERDPWSGNLAFPGGRIKQDEAPRLAAERETAEEIGLLLEEARFLGRLPDIKGSHLPVSVSCFIYGVPAENPQKMELNYEVQDAFWIGIDELAVPERHIVSGVTFGGEAFEMPAIYIPRPDTPVLWGLTYRLVMEFLNILRSQER
jgi:8-oxo-dGTP pyrophosphatase MutT (NUDIX family)